MPSVSVKEKIIHELDKLTPEQQKVLLDVARQLQKSSLPTGTPGDILIDHMDKFEFAPGAIDEIMQTIEEGTERIDWDGWQ